MGHRFVRGLVMSAIAVLFSGTVLSQGSPAEPPRPTLRPGSQGSEVRELQATLQLLGFYSGPVDGVYGDGTQQAVSQFQQAAGLPPDGIAGDSTWNRLLPPLPTATASSPTIPNPVASPTPPTAPERSQPGSEEKNRPTLRLGMAGPDVSDLQARLRAIGVFAESVDGVFGLATEAAVKAAQTRFGLEPDGVVGPVTWQVILEQP